jgi:PTH1 family peptidyl-tRNA hydrolase
MKIVAGLGNPGSEYDATRHNVGWWVVDRVAHDWKLGGFKRVGPALVAEGQWEGLPITLVKPLTYMNRSGAALIPYLGAEGFDVARDLLVVVDDAAREVGRVRFRPTGSAGGHGGLKSVEAVVGSRNYARLRIGVGHPPPGEGMVDWVLSPPTPEDEERLVALLPDLAAAVGTWAKDGIEVAMNRWNA